MQFKVHDDHLTCCETEKPEFEQNETTIWIRLSFDRLD